MRDANDVHALGLADGVETRVIAWLEQGGREPMPLVSRYADDARVTAMRAFLLIHGVGASRARELVDVHGVRSLEELRRRGGAWLARLYGPASAVGLERYADLVLKIPRDEVAAIASQVADAARACCAGATAETCGSFRRGAARSGDVDVLLAPPEGAEGSLRLGDVLAKLRANGLLTDCLATSERSFMGVVRLLLPGALHRRLDIKIYARKELPYALLYFTGARARFPALPLSSPTS